MAHFSTGLGLAVLGGCIFATSVLSSSHPERGAFAQSHSAQTVMSATGHQMAAIDPPANTPIQAAEAINTCESYAGGWFNPDIHLFPNCVGNAGQIGASPLAASDVNGDGQLDFFDYKSPTPDRSFFWVVQNGSGIAGSAELYQTSTMPTAYVRTDILPFGSNLGEDIRSKIGAYPRIGVTPKGWRDIDGDGDLDLVVVLELFTSNIDTYKLQKDAWFENTGFQHQAPVFGDLDGDGFVGGSDISLLLLNWSDH